MTPAIPLQLADIPEHARTRFWVKVQKSDACWLWTASTNSKGYGLVGFDKVLYLAHRVSLVLAGVTLDPALTIDHLCRNKRCVRPDHLEQVPGRINSRRYADTIVTCRHGHELVGDNVRVDRRGKRICRRCARRRCALDRRRHTPERKEAKRQRNRARYLIRTATP